MNGYLKYVLENCEIALNELCRINKELKAEMNLNSNADVNRLGALDRMIKDYLVIRVAGLFDKDIRTISFENLFKNNPKLDSIKNENIIKELLEVRHKFIAHSDRNYIEEGKFSIETAKICNSNLREIFIKLKKLINVYDYKIVV